MIEMEGKTLQSNRLTYRLVKYCDFLPLMKIVSEPETTEPAGFKAITLLENFVLFFVSLTAYKTAIAILLDGKCIGYVHGNKYQLEPNDDPTKKYIEIGFLLGKDYIGKGYGTEAVTTISDYLLQYFDVVYADYFLENTASRNCLIKSGFIEHEPYSLYFELLGQNKDLMSMKKERKNV